MICFLFMLQLEYNVELGQRVLNDNIQSKKFINNFLISYLFLIYLNNYFLIF